MFDYAVPLMCGALLLNAFNVHRFYMCAAFLVISLFCSTLQVTGTQLDFLSYSALELLFICFCCKLNTDDSVIDAMIYISVLSICVQLFGSIAWAFSDLTIYYKLTEVVFTMQIAGLIYGGFKRINISNPNQYNNPMAFSKGAKG